MLFVVEIKFINCLAGLMRHWIAQSDGRVNRHFKVIDLASGNLWNRHRLECGFNQSAFSISCIMNNYAVHYVLNHPDTSKIVSHPPELSRKETAQGMIP
jgi:hypothetical protein